MASSRPLFPEDHAAPGSRGGASDSPAPPGEGGITVGRDAGGIVTITIALPGGRPNVFDAAFLGDLATVLDGLDQCADTHKGATVDEKGCPKDSDGDGVWDGLDQCEGTPAGMKVDEKGCPTEVAQREAELLETGLIRLEGVKFETGKAEILPESRGALDAVGLLLTKWPQLQVEIGGHTDSRGSAEGNRKLSQARAEAVRTYLTTTYTAIPAANLTAKGYGKSKPVVPNTNEESWARNRRVEFVVKNVDVLKQEAERRRTSGETPKP